MKITQLIKRLGMVKKPELQRELVLEAWQSCDEFFVGLAMSCDKNSIVPVSRIPEIDVDDGIDGGFTFDDFQILWDKITQVGADPKEVRGLLLDAAEASEFTIWNTFYRRILLRKLHEDMPMNVINQVLSELTGIPFVL